jgi:hypothetical protein
MKCICPYQDSSNEIASNYPFFKLEEAAAVASGYSPCCAYWRKNKEFRYHSQDACDEMDRWEQVLRRAVAGGELASKANRLEPTERLIPRSDLQSWLKEHKREYVFEENERNNAPIVTQRVKAIEEEIKAQSFNPNAITTEQKTFLRKTVKRKYDALTFSDATFAKAWIEGGRLGLWAIKNKKKFLPRGEAQ